MTRIPLTVVDRRPLTRTDASVCAASGTISVDDTLDDIEAKWCLAIAQAQYALPGGSSAIDVRRHAATELVADADLADAMRKWSEALDVAAMLNVPLEALFHRLRWLTPEERDQIGAPMPTGWPPQPVWRFYRVLVVHHLSCAGRTPLRIAS